MRIFFTFNSLIRKKNLKLIIFKNLNNHVLEKNNKFFKKKNELIF